MLELQGPNEHTIAQIKDACRDGLRAVKNTLEDQAVVPGAGAYELALHLVSALSLPSTAVTTALSFAINKTTSQAPCTTDCEGIGSLALTGTDEVQRHSEGQS